MNTPRFTQLSKCRKSLGGALLLAALTLPVFGAREAHASLIVHLKLDEGTGTTTANSVEGGADGTLVGAGSSWTTAVPENFISSAAYYNSGSKGDSVTLPNTSVGALGDFTIAGWINAVEYTGAGGGNDRILSKRNLTANASFIDLGFYNVAGGGVGIGLDVQVAGGPVDPKVASSAIDFSEGWLFVAATRNSDTGEIELYIGKPGETGVTRIGVGTDTAGLLAANTALLMIGNTEANIDRNGKVMFSDFRIYDTVLSASELESVRLEAIPEPGTTAMMIMAAPALAFFSLLKGRKGAAAN